MSIFDVPVTLGELVVFMFVVFLVHDIVEDFINRRKR